MGSKGLIFKDFFLRVLRAILVPQTFGTNEAWKGQGLGVEGPGGGGQRPYFFFFFGGGGGGGGGSIVE